MASIPGPWMGVWTQIDPRRLESRGGPHVLAALGQGCGAERLVELGLSVDEARAVLGHPRGHSVGRAIPWADVSYPPALREPLAMGPAVLCVEGDATLLDGRPCVAVVGTRRCSGRGAAFARHLGHELARAGVVVVSGLASGIDSAAHQGAIQAGEGRTIAVLGHGLGTTYPRSNVALRHAIIKGGGAVMSGWPDEKHPEKWTFPRRNKWVAAVADAVVVVEAPHKSGALLTARDAHGMGRPVWIVPGAPQAPQVAGNLAFLVEKMAEQRAQLAQLDMFLREAACGDANPRAGAQVVPAPVHMLHSVSDFVAHVSGAASRAPEPDWLQHILLGQTVSEVSCHTGVPVLTLYQRLGELELCGKLVPLSGGRYGLGRSV